jgi:hypothetical protein
MTTSTYVRRTVARVPRQSDAPPADPKPTVYRLRNPWTFHLVAACVVAAVTVAGGFTAAVLGAVRLDVVVGAVLFSLVLVAVLSSVQARFERRAPASAFKPVDPA